MDLMYKDKYEAARLELKKAEALLKQRNANTKQVLIKQKKLNEDLEKEISKRKDTEKKVKNAEREKQKLEEKLQSMELRLSRLESSVANLVRDQDRRGAEIAPHVQVTGGKIANSQQATPVFDHSTDQVNVAQEDKSRYTVSKGNQGNKRKRTEPRDASVLTKEKAACTDTATIASSVLTHLFESNTISDNKLKTELDIVSSKSMGKEIDSRQVAFSILHKILMACVRPIYKEQLAPFSWSPGHWFPGDISRPVENKMKSSQIEPFSLVSMWCDERALYERYLQWALLFSQGLDRIFPGHGITDSLAGLSRNIVLKEIEREMKKGMFSVSEVCCAATLAMAVYRSQGNVQAATSFVADLIMTLGKGDDEDAFQISYNGTLPLCMALEVWPSIIHADLAHNCGQFLHVVCHCILNDKFELHPLGAHDAAGQYAATFIRSCLQSFGNNAPESNEESLSDVTLPFRAYIRAKQHLD
eukprot:jgi/Picsp_1/394/NSC_00392-R1_---NA---